MIKNSSQTGKQQFLRLSVIVILLVLIGVGFFLLAHIILSGDQKAINLNPNFFAKEHSPKSTQSLEKPPRPFKIVFLGDLMFDRGIRSLARKEETGYDYFFSELKNFFNKVDLVVGNLEGPVTEAQSVSQGSEIGSTANLIFTFPPEITDTLIVNNIKLVNLGNNHILNFKASGLASTQDKLEQAKISFFGYSGLEDTPKKRVHLTTISFDATRNHQYQAQKLRLAFVNYNQFTSDGQEKVKLDLAYANQQADFIIVYTHWGIEYQTEANSVIQDLAHQLIDQGADLIIGSHPHVVQQIESYQGRQIYYSLGNTLFDQFFSQETKEGQLVEVEIMPGILSCKNYFQNQPSQEDVQTNSDVTINEQEKCSKTIKFTTKKTQIQADGLIKIVENEGKKS